MKYRFLRFDSTQVKWFSKRRIFALSIVSILIGVFSIWAYTNDNEYQWGYEISSPYYDDSVPHYEAPYDNEWGYTYSYGDEVGDSPYYIALESGLYPSRDEQPDLFDIFDELGIDLYFPGFNDSDAVPFGNNGIGITPLSFPQLWYIVQDTTTGFFNLLDPDLYVNGERMWRPYTPPIPTQDMWFPGSGAYYVFVSPRYGHSNNGWILINTAQMTNTTSAVRQLPAWAWIGPTYYQWQGMLISSSHIAAGFFRLEVEGENENNESSHNFGMRIVGYNNVPPNEEITLINNTLFSYTWIPSVPWHPPYNLNIPGPVEVDGDNNNFNAVLEDSMDASLCRYTNGPTLTSSFNFGSLNYIDIQPVHLPRTLNHLPRSRDTVDTGVQPGLSWGTHYDYILTRHGPAEVGRFRLQFRVDTPIIEIEIGPPNRSAGGPSYDGEVIIDFTVLQPDPPADPNDPNADFTGTKPDTSIPDENIGYNYLGSPTNNRERNEADIVVVIPPPNDYAFFHRPGDGWDYEDITIITPPGYEEIHRSLDNEGNLVVTLRPIIWSFEFFKTCMAIENDPFDPTTDRNTLPGAVFQLWWDLGDGWELAYTAQASNSEGLVVIGGTTDLVIPQPPFFAPPPYTSSVTQLRIVEVTPPPIGDYVLPDGHWYLHFDFDTWELRATDPFTNSVSGDPIFIRRYVASGLSGELEYGEFESYIGYAPYYSLHGFYSHYGGYIGPAPLEYVSRWHVGNRREEPDWIRLNHAINILTPQPNTIIIHTAGAPNMSFSADFHDIPNSTFHLVITDPNPVAVYPFYQGRTITTVPIMLPTLAPAANPHRISVSRNVTVRAADGADIILRMPVPDSTNTAIQERWATTLTTIGRHFIVEGTSNLTLGGGTGTLTVDGNASANLVGYRGGVQATGANATLTMQVGSIIYNSRSSVSGGGVTILSGASFIMHNGRIENNRAAGEGANGGGVNVSGIGSTFVMHNGVIYNNNAVNGGGAVHVINSTAIFTMNGGQLIENTAAQGGAVWIQGHAQFHMHGGELIGNIAGIGPGTHYVDWLPSGVVANRHGVGGGVKVCCSGRFYLHDGYLDGNTGRVGGGVFLGHGGRTGDGGYVDGTHSYFTMLGGTIRNNRATLAAAYFPGLEFDGDGGGVFMTRSGIFTMEGNDTKRIYGNIAENSGGGVRWVTGFWHTSDNTSIVEFIDNEAALYGGGIYIGGGTYAWVDGSLVYVPSSLTTYGNWVINENRAIRGGGVFIGENGTFNMTESEVSENTAERGGGLYLDEKAVFVFMCGSIDTNTATEIGGGVNVSGDDALFSIVGTGIKYITGNDAMQGGGVWVAREAEMRMQVLPQATNLNITNNIAIGMGGGIFTMDYEYGRTLTRITSPDIAFGNLTLFDVNFSGNTADRREFSPENALAVMPITAWSLLSACVHPLNNYDINFRNAFGDLPLTGGRGISPMLLITGTLLIAVGFLFGVVKWHNGKSLNHFVKDGETPKRRRQGIKYG